VATCSPGSGAVGSDSIFRLLPRETRSAIKRMMFVEPDARCTLSDLLHGRGHGGGLVCRCGGKECGGGLNTPPNEQDHEVDADEVDDGDEWLRNIVPCSQQDGRPTCGHSHIKVMAEEKLKRRFF